MLPGFAANNSPVCYAFWLCTSSMFIPYTGKHSCNTLFQEDLSMNQLDSIKQFTTVVADSGDIESIRHYHPEDATTNPSLLLKAAGLASYSGLIDDAIAWAKNRVAAAKRRWLTPAISWRSILARRSSKAFRDGSPPRWTPGSPSTARKYREGSPPGGAVSGDGH